jgi:hypothetical protein
VEQASVKPGSVGRRVWDGHSSRSPFLAESGQSPRVDASHKIFLIVFPKWEPLNTKDLHDQIAPRGAISPFLHAHSKGTALDGSHCRLRINTGASVGGSAKGNSTYHCPAAIRNTNSSRDFHARTSLVSEGK